MSDLGGMIYNYNELSAFHCWFYNVFSDKYKIIFIN